MNTREKGPLDQQTYEIFGGTSDMAALCRAEDWSATPLGPVETWSQSQKTATGIVLANAFPMILLWGPRFTQIYNDAYRVIMGARHPAGLGQPNRECWPDVWDINQPIYHAVRGGETVYRENALYPLFRHGYLEDVYLTLSYSPVPDDNGDVGGVLVTLFETTDQMRAEEASRAKSQFIAVMSHELRTPLGGVIGYADLLATEVFGPLTAEQKEQLARIKASSWHLVSVIDEILTFSRTEAGKERVSLVDTDGNALAAESAMVLESQAMTCGVQLNVYPSETPVRARVDIGKARQILLNLLGNALKFTEHGSVSLDVSTEGDRVLFRVRDTGPGIAPESLPHIFDPFWQADSTATRSKGGTGLGLTVSRRLAQLMGGDIIAESEQGKGSTFTFFVPGASRENREVRGT